MLIDDLGPLIETPIGSAIEELIRHARSPNLTVVVALENVDGRAAFKPIIREIRSHRKSLVLRPDALPDSEIAGTDLPRVKTHTWPPGRGFLVEENEVRLVQVIDPT